MIISNNFDLAFNVKIKLSYRFQIIIVNCNILFILIDLIIYLEIIWFIILRSELINF